jgi:hypothetical protein
MPIPEKNRQTANPPGIWSTAGSQADTLTMAYKDDSAASAKRQNMYGGMQQSELCCGAFAFDRCHMKFAAAIIQ